MFIREIIQKDQIGLVFQGGVFQRILQSGRHWVWNLRNDTSLEMVNLRDYVFSHPKLKDLIDAGAIEKLEAEVLDVKDHSRALLWKDGRFDRIVGPGTYLLWKRFADFRVEIVDAREVEFQHQEIKAMGQASVDLWLQNVAVPANHVAVLFLDGVFQKVLPSGRYYFWRQMANITTEVVDLRQTSIDINGQDLITADHVTIRINALVTYQVSDPALAVKTSDNLHQSIYRLAQLTLRSVVGKRTLDELLESKDWVAEVAMEHLKVLGKDLGIEFLSVGVRDLILPGEMKILLNRVIEAKKQAEANLILRREETSAIRSQANTAKLLDNHPTLMRLRELEVLEKVAESSDLKVVLGTGDSLTDRVAGLL